MTIIHRRNLPHIHPTGAIFFVTFRLAGSIPVEVIEQLRAEFEQEERRLKTNLSENALLMERYKIQKKFFGRYDEWLDKMAHGPTHLRDAEIAEIIMQEIRRLDGIRYDMLAYCIMPNHVHLLADFSRFDKNDGKKRLSPLSQALRLIKGRSARYANLKLGHSGKFWQDESYDHFVRNNGELTRILNYIVENPVKAGLAKSWDEWAYIYVAQTVAQA
ncbi:MAG: transposase [Anaerolineales bacterium]|nr:transposase [Anaerolineales bacterium]